MNRSDKFLMNAIMEVRQGDKDLYSAGIKFGYAMGMLHALPVPEYLRMLDLLNNAATYAGNERRQAAIAAIKEAA